MSQQVANQLEKVYFNIQPFLKSWYNSNSIMRVYEFKERLKNYFKNFHITALNKLFDDLFIFGIIGICGGAEGKENAKCTKKFHEQYSINLV